MPAVIDSFSRTYNYHRMSIKKGFGQDTEEKLEDFLQEFRQNYYPKERVIFVDPGLGWQMCQHDGEVCVGVFVVAQMDGPRADFKRIAIISTTVHHMEHAALDWLLANRQRNDTGRWPSVDLSSTISIQAIMVPSEGMLFQ